MRSLYAKLSLTLALLLAGVGVLYVLLSTGAAQRHAAEVNQRFNRDLAANLVADRGIVAGRRIDEAALAETFRRYMVVNPSIEIYLLDPRGELVSYSADPGKVKRRGVDLAPVRAFLRGDASYPMLGDDPRSHDRRKAFSVTPVPWDGGETGYLYVILRGEEYESLNRMLQESYLLRLGAWALAASLAVGLVAGLLMLRVPTRRLRRLAAMMEAFREEGIPSSARDAERADHGGDEIDQLGRSFEAMAARIRDQLDELEQNDALRRELVANVSHDLRTPLASLHGYLETLQLKGDRLDGRERAEYLATALRSSERLRRLVEELFELATLDAREVGPHCEPFSMPELAQDVVQKLQLRARERGVALELERGPGAGYVSADIGLVERVLENLIENALAHTPGGGHIGVQVGQETGQITVRVSDTGCGIDPQALPRIFERFYRAGNAHRGCEHAGLGLAIAKRILELHGTTIRVESTQGHGAAFEFCLPEAA